MTSGKTSITRRGLGLAAAGIGLAGFSHGAAAQSGYPARNFRVVIPTGQGGGADRLARSFDDGWSKQLNGRQFEYEFFPGASGQVGYELYVNRRDKDGYHLLFGNMGPEMLMYALQRPRFRFPEDITYFCRIDVDDSCVFVRANSPFRRIEDVVAEAKRRPLNVATSRIPHPASIGILALGEAQDARFNLVPYGGGNPTLVAVLNGEADIGVLPIALVVQQGERMRTLGVFNNENIMAEKSNNAPSVNQVFGTRIPPLPSSRSWALHTEVVERFPDRFKILEESAAKVFDDPAFREAYDKQGLPIETIRYGNRQVCTEYAQGMIELANRYRAQLTAQR
ncbi:MAG TPA: tripartite tricarboxylate transporter substrate-binding protein [Falsiroseomonas sp.]|jgi:tripartite-type tricarboxylate transporter receptor subunit TctC|nr:tripartite tricarboxylate transporter substrate-binding protein [Falsiroseomonas sp.]